MEEVLGGRLRTAPVLVRVGERVLPVTRPVGEHEGADVYGHGAVATLVPVRVVNTDPDPLPSLSTVGAQLNEEKPEGDGPAGVQDLIRQSPTAMRPIRAPADLANLALLTSTTAGRRVLTRTYRGLPILLVIPQVIGLAAPVGVSAVDAVCLLPISVRKVGAHRVLGPDAQAAITDFEIEVR